ncbi:amidohydrolase [Desmospora activa DSM 45169]|uniref:Amidohydrolase n=2 Tax=Desmospora TaxID=500614 RepID=A0A2T4ZAY9_9BACL|nr:amidohydrolase [Desmospora activa]PTM59058.1 amidohydrolase [Desmospora activa DSM 45169]
MPSIEAGSPFLQKACQLQGELTAWRRDFHRHPELGFEEERTAAIVADHLESLGLEVKRGVGKTGVVGLLRGKEPGPCIGIRADMDALPIQDQKEIAYRSTIPGKAHVCGHDAHTSILMGTAQFLSQQAKIARGSVKFIFQPAEEGLGGAEVMIQDGVLQDPPVDAIIGLHVNTTIPTGRITLVKGVGCAAADEILIRIIGKGGHAAQPHQAVDSVSVTAEVLSALQHIVSRQMDPLESAVITIGKIQGGAAGNIIAPDVNMIGTVRTLNPLVREQMPERIEQVIKGVTTALGADYEFTYNKGYPSIVNDGVMVDRMKHTATRVLGSDRYEMVKPTMGGEDFSYFTQQVPGVFFRLGVRNEAKQCTYPGHHPMFNLDEAALPIGVALFSQFVHDYLNQEEDLS